MNKENHFSLRDRLAGLSRVTRDFDLWEAFMSVIGLAAAVYWVVFSRDSTPAWFALAAASLMLIALMLRKRFAIAALSVAVAVAGVTPFLHTDAGASWTVLQVVLFSISLRWPMRRTLWMAVGCAVFLAGLCVVGYQQLILSGLPLAVIAWTFGVWGLASSVASQRAVVVALARQTEELLRGREAEIARRLTEQRVQIARDLHDELAHDVAVISVSAGAAEAALPSDPGSVADALRTIRVTGRAVLQELQQILGLLRADAEADVESPLPRIDDVISTARRLGLRIQVEGPWLPESEPAASQIAAARIVQEALTNAHRHGYDGAVRLKFALTDRHWTFCAINAVAIGATGHRRLGSGLGLVGMRERAELSGGQLRHQLVDGSFVLTLTVPLTISPPTLATIRWEHRSELTS